MTIKCKEMLTFSPHLCHLEKYSILLLFFLSSVVWTQKITNGNGNGLNGKINKFLLNNFTEQGIGIGIGKCNKTYYIIIKSKRYLV